MASSLHRKRVTPTRPIRVRGLATVTAQRPTNSLPTTGAAMVRIPPRPVVPVTRIASEECACRVAASLEAAPPCQVAFRSISPSHASTDPAQWTGAGHGVIVLRAEFARTVGAEAVVHPRNALRSCPRALTRILRSTGECPASACLRAARTSIARQVSSVRRVAQNVRSIRVAGASKTASVPQRLRGAGRCTATAIRTPVGRKSRESFS